MLGAGEFDVGTNFAGPLVVALDMGAPISLIGGVHVGCFRPFATDQVRSIKDLKGKTVAILNKDQRSVYSLRASSVGPIQTVTSTGSISARRGQASAGGRQDRRLSRPPPDPQSARTRSAASVSSGADRPWSSTSAAVAATGLRAEEPGGH
jgi:NitT/TauT family transport system substrate-binding protein